jgi:hypothetical protein
MVGVSMVPTIIEGQRVLIRLGRRHLQRGDLLLFRLREELVVHRLHGRTITAAGRPGLWTRGDGRQFFDPPIEPDAVEGRVIALEADGFWWDLRGGGARLYAIAIALHNFFWALLALLVRKVERSWPSSGPGTALGSMVGRMDGALLGLAHRLFFRRLHPRSVSPPDGGCYTAALPD